MDVMDKNKAYNDYILAKEPKTKWFPSLLWAFLIGGLICCLGEGIKDFLKHVCNITAKEEIASWVSSTLIFIASFLTGIGVYDRIGAFAGAGSIVPITGYSNSVTSPAMEFRREGIIFGTCAKMFLIAGPVIVNGLAISSFIGLIYYIFGV